MPSGPGEPPGSLQASCNSQHTPEFTLSPPGTTSPPFKIPHEAGSEGMEDIWGDFLILVGTQGDGSLDVLDLQCLGTWGVGGLSSRWLYSWDWHSFRHGSGTETQDCETQGQTEAITSCEKTCLSQGLGRWLLPLL